MLEIAKVKTVASQDTIYFYENPNNPTQASHLFLNVHYYCTFKGDDGREYHSCTDYYHTNKFLILGDLVNAEAIHKISSAEEAYGKSKEIEKAYFDKPVWKEWESKKVEIMKKAIWLKFTQNPELEQRLMMTGDKILIEDHPRDDFW